MVEGLTKLVADGKDFFEVVNCAREKLNVKPIGRAITIKKLDVDRKLKPKITQRAPDGADAYTVSPAAKTNGSCINVYAVQYYRIV